MTGCEQPRQPVEGSGQVVAALVRFRLPRMQGHAHPERAELTPVLGKQRPLGIKGRGNGGGRRGEGGLDGIPDRLEVDAAMRLDGRIEQGHVALDGRGHRLPVPLPERGAALDVGKEEGDGAGGEIGHGPFPRCRSRMNRVGLSHAYAPQKRLLWERACHPFCIPPRFL